jgi:hypothetical protein
LYSSPNITRTVKSKIMRWKEHVARMGKKRSAHKVLVGNPEGKRPLGRPGRGWEDNIEMDLRERGWGGVDLINLAQDPCIRSEQGPVVGSCQHGNEPSGSIKCWEIHE